MDDFRATATKVGDDLYVIDAGMFGEPQRLACYLLDAPQRVLIECGPTVTIQHLYRALDELGIDDLAVMAVTHIHLDHAGGAGDLALRYPRAKIGVHRLGAPHLIDPARLLASAERIYGEEGMRTLWGPMEPIDPQRLLVLDEGDRIPLGGGRHLEVMYTPGHAKHHIVFADQQSGGMFVGDSVGIAFPHGHMVQPVTPPPDFDPQLVAAQLRRMAAESPNFVGFAHYGIAGDSDRVFGEAEARLEEWVRFVEQLDDSEDAMTRLRDWVLDGYRRQGISAQEIEIYDRNTYWPMQPAGIQRWLRLREQE